MDESDTRTDHDPVSSRVVTAVEALLQVAHGPLAVDRLVALIETDEHVDRASVRAALDVLATRYAASAAEVVSVASGWRLQVRAEHADLVARLWADKPPKLSRAVLETLAIIVYRQPLARSDIEAIRGVSVSTQIIKTLSEYEWIKVIGHREVPGRPALYATTPRFLDDFGVSRLADLPRLPEIKDAEALEAAIARLGASSAAPQTSAAANEQPADEAPDTGAPGDRPLE
ncbi:SMC-Scp complex subunit ScpB [Salinisphaera sp. Q1T1-3]|uniref:SMC-Scp complex subunit ScpB n=1 Tax=Salinisphaera sp. Q1T1-3 TaxID=2321229 RepID=UPI000E71530A|nr:SMC-Scp complex subunit ScpB [Salinisphaera sp. Q1T1-3]RJS92696.1 SMC-Scp complex subunit ScpB [Salinisphaera sp. Q1T1-3]